MFNADLDELYGMTFSAHSGLSRSKIFVIEPSSLDWLTILAVGDLRSSGSIALVTVITPNTFVS